MTQRTTAPALAAALPGAAATTDGAATDPHDRHVAFRSETKFDDAHTGANSQLYLFDREAGGVELVSRAGGDGPAADQTVISYDMSPDARFFAFEVRSNYLADATSSWPKVFVPDRLGRTTHYVSANSDGEHAYDMDAGATSLASRGSAGGEGNGSSTWPSVSADGRHVAFVSNASNLVPHDTNQALDGFVHDRVTGATERVSVADQGGEPERGSREAAISPSGRYVAFVSNAVALGEDGSVNTSEVFLHDRWARTTERVSLRDDGEPVSSRALFPAVSDQGTVTFSSARTMVAAMPSSFRKVYVRDRGPEVGPAWLAATAAGDEPDGHAVWARVCLGADCGMVPAR